MRGNKAVNYNSVIYLEMVSYIKMFSFILNDSRQLCFWASHDLCHSYQLLPSSAHLGIMPNFRYMGSYHVWTNKQLYLSIYTDECFSFKISVRCKISRKQFYNSLSEPGRKVMERFFPPSEKHLQQSHWFVFGRNPQCQQQL